MLYKYSIILTAWQYGIGSPIGQFLVYNKRTEFDKAIKKGSMTISEQLMTDMKTAMKAHDSQALGVIGFLRSSIQNAQIDGAGSDDNSIQKIIASQVKKSKEAVAEFVKAGREDLAGEERAKIQVMEKYLPTQLDDAALEAIVREVIGDVLDKSKSGQLIGQVMKKVAGQADGGRVKAMVEKILAD